MPSPYFFWLVFGGKVTYVRRCFCISCESRKPVVYDFTPDLQVIDGRDQLPGGESPARVAMRGVGLLSVERLLGDAVRIRRRHCRSRGPACVSQTEGFEEPLCVDVLNWLSTHL